MFSLLKKLFPQKQSDYDKTVEANRIQHAQDKKAWDAQQRTSKSDTCELNERYISKAGNIYLDYVNIEKMTVVRKVKFGECLTSLRFGLNEDFLKFFSSSTKEAIKQGNAQLALAKIAEFEERAKTCVEEKMLFKLASLLLVRHDENPYSYNPKMEALKRMECEQDADLHAFFLNIAYLYTQKLLEDKYKELSITNETDFLNYIFQIDGMKM